MPTKLTTERFIEKARERHGNLYDYPDEYINGDTKIRIWCGKCEKYFKQTPHCHLGGKSRKGQGCPICSNSLRKSTTEEFIQKSKNIHGDLYNYDQIEYIDAKTKVKIWCNECEKYFEQSPNHHISGKKGENKGRGYGCPICNDVKLTNDEIINNLTMEEEPIEVDGEIQCRCTYCKEYFTPTRRQLNRRSNSLSGKSKGESRLYCSDKCKDLCPIFGQKTYYKDQNKPNTSRPDQPELKQFVLTRDNNQCQRCGSSENLICHHITGVEINPIESADIDNCITLCYTCHSRVHSEKGCSMQRQPCSVTGE